MAAIVVDHDSLMTRQEAARFLQVNAQTLASWACNGRYKIPFMRVGRAIRYRRSDLESWLASRTVNGEVCNE
jgi:excisionase family DNA binding protein